MKKTRCIFSVMMVLCMLLVMLPMTAHAYNLIGTDINYTFNANTGTLTFTGKGAMPDYNGSLNLVYQQYWMTYDRGLDVRAVKKLVFGEGITHIGRASFLNFVNLESVKFPGTLTSIGAYAFAQSGLASVTLPKNLETIGAYAFMKCELTGIDLPDSLISIGMGAFANTDLTQIVVPKGVTTVSSGVFSGCSELVSATFEGSIAGVGGNAFYNCAKLTSVSFKQGVSGVIGGNAFYNCANLTNIVLTEGVTEIGESAFDGCKSISNMVIPEGVAYIRSQAFRSCDGITAITLPESLVFIDGTAFVFCDNLKELTLHSTTQIKKPLVDAKQMSYVHVIGNAPDHWIPTAFGTPSEAFVMYYDRGTTGWGPYTWNQYVIEVWGEPESVKTGTCGENATWTLENGVMTVSGTGPVDGYGPGSSPWYNIKHKIKKLVIEDGITEIGQAAFYSLHRMTEVSIPDSVTSLGSDCFGLCQSLTKITIPAGITKIGTSFVWNEMYIEAVYFQGDAPDIYGSAFSGADFTAYYPMGNNTWTEDVLKDYGGTVTWEPYCPEHNYDIVVKEPSCDEGGGTVRTCSICGDGDVINEIPALGHVWSDGTCDNPRTCTVCGTASGKHHGHIYDDNVDGSCAYCEVLRQDVEKRQVVHMFRMYNPNTGEHFYTGSEVEKSDLIEAGWQYEGIGFTFPANMGAPVYRLFQPSTGEHLYTMDVKEKEKLEAEGWNYEGIAFNSAFNTEAVQHRLHNPNATVGAYHFTFSEEEKQNLINAGWEYQGIGWYSCWK